MCVDKLGGTKVTCISINFYVTLDSNAPLTFPLHEEEIQFVICGEGT